MQRQKVLRRKGGNFFLFMKRPKSHSENHKSASRWRDFILGGQDGLVNVLGVTLGVATATKDLSIILTAAFAATFAESISMGAVAYTSFKAEKDFYLSQVKLEEQEIEDIPQKEKQEIKTIYSKLGFRGSLLTQIVDHITANKKRWRDVMVSQELKLSAPKVSPTNSAWVVGISALVGSIVPTIPFFLMPVSTAMWASVFLSTIVLFSVGAYKAKTTTGNIFRSGVELALIGIAAALAGYAIGALLGATLF